MSKITAVEYRPTRRTTKQQKKGAKTKESSYYIRVKNGNVWAELCTVVQDKGDDVYCYTGTMCREKASIGIAAVMSRFGIAIPPAVASAAKEAEKKLAAKAVKRLERDIGFIEDGPQLARSKAADKAEGRWEKMNMIKGDLENMLQSARKRAGIESAAE